MRKHEAIQKTAGGDELANLDCLRAFAVLSVVLDHIGSMLASIRGAQPAPWGVVVGHVGVLAFFVHTSLVLMFSLERLSQFPRLVTARFYLRRFFRIYPLSVLCVSGALVLKIPAIPWAGTAFQMPSQVVAASNLLLIQNLVGGQSVCAPLWSLPFEVQMYLALPVCFFRACRRDCVSCVGWCLILFVSLALVVKHSTGHANLLAYIPCFLAGVFAYTMRRTIQPRLTPAAWPAFLCLWVAGFTILIAKWPANEMEVGWLACLLLGLSVYCFTDCRNRLWNRVTAGVAKYSYGIYLAHVPMLWLVFRVWGITNAILGSGVWLAMTALFAVLGYHLVEAPMIEVGRKLTTRVQRSAASAA